MICVESPNGQESFGSFELPLDKTVFPAAVGFQSQTAVGPPFGAKTMGRLNQSDQESCPNGSNQRNLA
jgi:hypothetical protein